jgi:DNA replication protein DnaC
LESELAELEQERRSAYQVLVAQEIPPLYDNATPGTLRPALAKWDWTTGLYLHGPTGSGKTWQVAALIRHTRHQMQNGVAWWRTDDYLHTARKCMGSRATKNDHRRVDNARAASLLVLDDLGAERHTDWVEESLYGLLAHRLEYQIGRVAITTNYTLPELAERVGARTASRIGQLTKQLHLDGPDLRIEAPQ